MGYAYENPYWRGAETFVNNMNNRQSGEPSPLAGLFGANQMRGGVTLNPDGTVKSVDQVAPQHHILDAIFNRGLAAKQAQAQNARLGEMALQTTQSMTQQKQIAEIQQQKQAAANAALEKRAYNAMLADYDKANNTISTRPDGSLTDAGFIARNGVDPERMKAKMREILTQDAITANPDVQAARTKEAIAQANTPAVDNAAKSFHSVSQGGAGVIMNPDEPTQAIGTLTGGSPAAQSVTQPVTKMVGGQPFHMGDTTQSSSVVNPGGYSPSVPTMSPNDFLNQVRTTNSAGKVTEVTPPTAAAKPVSFASKAGSALSSIGDVIAKSGQKPQVPIDNSVTNQLLAAGAQQAQAQQQTKQPVVSSNLTLNPTDLSTMVGNGYQQDDSQDNQTLLQHIRAMLMRNNVQGF